MKASISLILAFTLWQIAPAQVKWSSQKISDTVWNNYSTVYIGDMDTKSPILMAALPNNGAYFESGSNAPLDMEFEKSLYRFQSTLTGRMGSQTQVLQSSDSGLVYFLTPGIYPATAANYEYRILQNGKEVVKDWTSITDFSDVQINTFQKGFGFLGGYQTTWGNYISAELRRKNEDTAFAVTVVRWTETRPSVAAVFSQKNMDQFFSVLQRSWDSPREAGYSPNNLELPSTENALVFLLSAHIYRKDAVEYRLTQDGKLLRDWGPNEYDNNFIWLKDLPPGKFELQVRYSRQRHMVTTCSFRIKPNWTQTAWFRASLGSLLAAFLGFIWLLFRNRAQQRKLKAAQQARTQLQLGMQGVNSQLNPHFLFNALSSIQSLVNQHNTGAANTYLADFSQLLRQSLEVQEKETVPLQWEKDWIGVYLKLEQLRFGFSYSVTVAPGLDALEIPVFLLQPVVENAVRHGVSHLGKAGTIRVDFAAEADKLVITVTDNGKGYHPPITVTGYGLALTRKRIALHNQAWPERPVRFTIKPGSSTGTIAVFELEHIIS